MALPIFESDKKHGMRIEFSAITKHNHVIFSLIQTWCADIIFSHNETRCVHIIFSDNKRWHAFINFRNNKIWRVI